MTDEAQETISAITEIDDRLFPAPARAFFRAVCWGALAGGGIWLLLTVPMGLIMALGDHDPDGLVLAVFPLLIAGGGTLLGMLLISLPLTALLIRTGSESPTRYAGLGVLFGSVTPVVVLGLTADAWVAGLFFALFGMFSGLAAGTSWGNWRERLGTPPEDRPNRFHDLMY